MSRFLKIEGESVWVNISNIDALVVRPQLMAVGQAHGLGSLEELHEATGKFEVVAHFQNQLNTVGAFATRAEAEAFVKDLLGKLEL